MTLRVTVFFAVALVAFLVAATAFATGMASAPALSTAASFVLVMGSTLATGHESDVWQI